MTAAAPVFRFDVEKHVYTLGGVVIPSVTQLIERGGLVAGSDYFTEASRTRGTEVHRLCADYDLGVLSKEKLDSPFAGYVLGYIAACEALKPSWDRIEEADVHYGYRYAGRIDRVGAVVQRNTVCELKSAAKAKHHQIQTALQAILAGGHSPLPAEQWQRMTIYLKKTGKWAVDVHEDRRDFDVARRLIKEFC